MKLKHLIPISCILMLAMPTVADTIWTGGGVSNNVNDVANWDNGAPSVSNIGIVSAPEIVSGTGESFSDMRLLFQSGALMFVDISGLITGTEIIISGVGSHLAALNNIDLTLGFNTTTNANGLTIGAGAEVSGLGNVFIGVQSYAEVTQIGGQFNFLNGLLDLGSVSTSGYYDLKGGTVNVGDLSFNSGSTFNFDTTGTGGSLTVGTNGTFVTSQSDIEGLITGGSIVLDDTTATLADFDITDNGDGTFKVEAIPEPAVISLLVLNGLGMLAFKRLSKLKR